MLYLLVFEFLIVIVNHVKGLGLFIDLWVQLDFLVTLSPRRRQSEPWTVAATPNLLPAAVAAIHLTAGDSQMN